MSTTNKCLTPWTESAVNIGPGLGFYQLTTLPDVLFTSHQCQNQTIASSRSAGYNQMTMITVTVDQYLHWFHWQTGRFGFLYKMIAWAAGTRTVSTLKSERSEFCCVIVLALILLRGLNGSISSFTVQTSKSQKVSRKSSSRQKYWQGMRLAWFHTFWQIFEVKLSTFSVTNPKA